MKFFIICIIFLGFIAHAQAQNGRVLDSLKRVYQSATHDTSKILILNEIAYEYKTTKPDTCLLLAQKNLEKSEKIGFQKGIAMSWNRIGLAYYTQTKYSQAVDYLQKSLYLFEKIQQNKEIAATLNTLGVVYYTQANYTKALEAYQKSYEISQKIGDKRGTAACLNNIGLIYYLQANYAKALTYQEKALKIFQQTQNHQDIAAALNGIGLSHYQQGNYLKALEYYQKTFESYQKIANEQGIAASLNNIGNVHNYEKNYSKALEYYQKSLDAYQKINNQRGLAMAFNNLGFVYQQQGNYEEALEYYQKSLDIKTTTNDKKGMTSSLHNIGDTYGHLGNYELAHQFYQKSLQIRQELGDKRGISSTLNGIANVYQKEKKYTESLENAEKGLQIAQQIGALPEVKALSQTLFETYKLQKNYAKALEYHELFKQTNDSIFDVEKAKKIANLEATADLERQQREIEVLNKNQELLQKDNQLQKIESEKQKTARLAIQKQAEAERLLALARQEKDKSKADSLYNLSEKIRLESVFLKLKEQQLQAQNKADKLEILKEKEEIEFQKKINYLILSIFLAVLVLTYFIYLAKQREKRAKELVGVQKEEIELQSEELQITNQALNLIYLEIQRKNDDIIASINYALRIQNAIIPKESELQKHFDCFVFFRPRDIVSGDFYWFAKKQGIGLREQGLGNSEKLKAEPYAQTPDIYILAVADCTGHGVSGAFMTMIGNNILNHIVHDLDIHQPDQILNLMPTLLEKTLQHADGQLKDGMDISILTFQKFQTFGTFKVSYAGAMNPLYYVQNQEFKEIKADKRSIGGEIEEKFLYQKHDIWVEGLEDRKLENPQTLSPNPFTLYLCSDGFQDQFGGEKDKKFMVGKLKKLLYEISEKTMLEQKQLLENSFDNWKGQNEQTDDVMLVGLRF